MAKPVSVDWDDIFLEAALEPERWLGALGTMAAYTGAAHGQLIGIGPARDIPFNLVSDMAPANLEASFDAAASSPESNFRIAANARHMAHGYYDPLLHERHYDEVIPTLHSRRYVDWCEAIDIPFGCQTNLVVDSGGIIGFAMLRKRREGRTTQLHRRMFAGAAAAARRAVRLQERLEGEQAKLLAGAFEAIGVTAFFLDTGGRVLAHTRGADDLLVAGKIGIRDGRLNASATPLSLAEAARVLTADDGWKHLRLALDTAPGRPQLFLEGFRLPARAAWSLGKLPRAVLIANAPRRDRAGVTAFLTALYGLTAAEADIAVRLYKGYARQEIAVQRSVCVETLRSQIKSIYAKTGVAGEAQLVRLLSAIMG